jgi:predicted RNA binding protein YcfA (HicA-like mRNA interferase family)
MPKLPLISAIQLAKVLNKMGFELKRQKGSHMFFRHPDGRATVVPMHSREKIDTGLLNKIIRKDLGIDREQFLDLFDSI